VALFPPGTISRNEQFHEAQVEILQGVTRCSTQPAGGSLQLRADVGEPNAANHSKLGTQLCRRTPWMCFQKFFHVFSEPRRQFLGLEREHIQKTHAHAFLDCQTLRSRSGRRNDTMAFTECATRSANVVAACVSDAVATWDLTPAPNHRDRSR
jgi:hypothetical protein